VPFPFSFTASDNAVTGAASNGGSTRRGREFTQEFLHGQQLGFLFLQITFQLSVATKRNTANGRADAVIIMNIIIDSVAANGRGRQTELIRIVRVNSTGQALVLHCVVPMKK